MGVNSSRLETLTYIQVTPGLSNMNLARETTFGVYTVSENIGRGGQAGCVQLVKRSDTHELLARKIVGRTERAPRSGQYKETEEKEIMLYLQQFSTPSPYLTQLIGYQEASPSQSKCTLLLEYCNGGDL